MLRVREFSSQRRYPSGKARRQSRGAGFRTPRLGLRDRFRRLGESRTAFHVGLRHPAAKVAVALFVVLDLILVYRLTVNDSPAPITSVPGEAGASSARGATVDELRKALGDLDEKVSAIKLFGRNESPGTQHSTNRNGSGTSQVASTSTGSSSGSGGSATGSGSGGSSTSSGSGDLSTGSSGSSTGGGPGGGGLPGGGSGDGGTGGGGGGGGGG